MYVEDFMERFTFDPDCESIFIETPVDEEEFKNKDDVIEKYGDKEILSFYVESGAGINYITLRLKEEE